MSASSSQQSQPSLQPLSSQQPLTSQQSRRNSTDSHQTSLSTSTYFDMENAFEKTIASKSLSPFLSMSLNSKDSNNNKIRNSWISSVSQLSSNIPFTIPHIEVYVEKCENLPAMSSSGFCDPYVVLSVIPLGDNELRDFSQIPSEESCKSSKIKKTLNPVWNGKERFFLGFPGLVNNANNYFSNSVSQSFNSKKQSQTKNTSISFNENKSKSTDSLLSATTTMTAATTSSKNATHHSLTHFQNKNYYLLIQVFSYDRLKKDSFIGSARIGPLSKLPYGVMLSKTVSLHEAGTSATCSIKFIAIILD
ncbi:hypothetical protein C9374_001163 [Naegleria lovaniensis]|uniref:C2 domain-containing protein n=1 Tax=Naegleria lovaniensis TaxID=51637 RepID=A0AA88GWT0_NAELO|nr:uncharacterized protein C9374_001163 [Naegleria lovaniensis]KAG2387569.1 hypothetical protein C9374_001163 [Naegleria lovaniensis]